MTAADGLRRAMRGLSEAAFRERFGTEAACREALFAMRWREGLTCPACGHRGFCQLRPARCSSATGARSSSRSPPARCSRHQAAADRLVRGDLPPDPGEERDQLDRAGAAAGGAAADGLAGEAQADAGHGRARGREAEARGRVEMDDAYLGGERSGGKRGRGAAGKTPFVAAVETTAERKPRRLRLTVVKGFRKREVERLAKAAIEPGSDVVSDGLSCWPAVEKAGCTHSPIVTGSGKPAASSRRSGGSTPPSATSRRRSPVRTTTSAPSTPNPT